MKLAVDTPAIVRFPPVPGLSCGLGVAIVRAYRADMVRVAKWRGPFGGTKRWSRPRWVPAAAVLRAASAREASVGVVIDPVPPREAA